MTSWKGKTRGGLLGYQIFISILRTFGINAAYLVLRFVVVYFIFFAPGASAAIFKYFRKIHGFNHFKAFLSIFRNYYIFGQTILDKIVLISGIKNPFSVTFSGEEHLIEMKNGNRGGFLISAHVGSWEIAGYFLKRLEAKINIVMFEAEHEKIKHYLDQVMGDKKWEVIPIRKDLSHIFKISSALSRNEIICIHGDRFVEGSKVVKKSFFGHDAFFPAGPFTLTTKLNVPCSYVYCLRGKSKEYHFFATPLSYGQKDIDTVIQEYVDSLEHIVLKFPYQWFNYYDFWDQRLASQ